MRRCLIVLALTIHLQASAQDEAATSAPILNPFSLKGDDLGSMASYVNQLTGEVTFPMNLVSIPGPGGLAISVAIGYSSANIENLIRIWNQEAPTGVLGLGWSMDTPLVMVDNKQTGARDDDEFYLVEGGASTRLVCVGVSGGVKSYRTATFSNWIIQYTESVEKWEVTKDDGTKFIYGDTQGTANSVQWTARWGNWMGNSGAAGQQLQAMSWNLREVRSVWGDRVTYSYLVGNISVGQGTLATEYSLLYKINDSWGHEVEFLPGQKSLDEYQSPPGVVLKRSERFFINKVLVRTNGALDYEQQLSYSTNEVGTGQLTKRLLKSITKVSPAGTIGPAVLFEYASAVQPYKGALTRVILPTGGSIGFTYDAGGYFYPKFVDRTENAPSGYAEPDVYLADDYALITWRQLSGGVHVEGPMTTIATVVDWKGKWRTHELGSIGAPKFINNAKDYRVALGRDFFAALVPTYGSTNYTLHLMHRKNGVNGEWQHTSETLDMAIGVINDRVRLFTGNNFVCASNNNGRIFRFVWNGNAWIRTDIVETLGERWTTATNNYILSHDPAPNPDVIRLYYLDQLMNWQTRTQAVTDFDSGPVDINPAYGEMTTWYPSNSSAFVMANESNEVIITWDENYNAITRVDPGWYYGDNSNVYFDGTTLGLTTQVYLGPPPSSFPLSKNRALRRSGNSWIDTGEKINGYGFSNAGSPGFGMAAFGPDVMAWNANTSFSSTFSFKYQTFDPAAGQWSSEVQLSNTDNPHVNVGPEYFTVGRKVYVKSASGYILATQQYLSGNDDVFPSSRRFIASASRIIWMRNGDVEEWQYSAGKYRVRNSTSHPYRYMAGTMAYVYCSTGFEDHFQDDTSLFLRRVTSVAGLYDHRVIKVQIDDGLAQQYVSFAYENPVFGPNEATVMYNKVTMVPGSQSVSSKPNGYTDTYFFNSLSPSEVSSPIPAEYPNGNGIDYYDLLSGQAYRIETFNATSNLVTSQTNILRVTPDHYLIGPQAYFYMNIPQPFKTTVTQDGRTEISEYIYDSRKQLSRQTVSTQNASGLWDQRYEEATYGWQVYPSMDSLNMLSQTVLTKQGITGSSVTHAEANRWKLWPCSGSYCASSNVPAPFDHYSWRGTGSPAFSNWDVAGPGPSADWRFGGQVLTRDTNTGAEIETTARGNTISSVVLDNLKRPIASVSNAGLSDIAFTGFEDGTSGLWSSSDGVIATGSARTGKKYLSVGTSGLSRTGLTTSTQYKLSFWAKTSGGSVQIDGVGTIALGSLSNWTLLQYTVTGLSTIGVRRSGATEVLMDEVRLHPVNSMMGTKTYHDVYGVDSESDANHRTMYTEFDEFGQPKLILDQNKHIVKHFFTNLK